MKKYIIGTIFGFVLATAVGANAQEVNKVIDSVVQGVFPVTVEGTSVGDAIVVNDKTYLPVREFGEAVGYKVTFTEDREVVLTKNASSGTIVNPPVSNKTVDEQIEDLNKNIDDLRKNIEKAKNLISVNEESQKNLNIPAVEIEKIVSMYKNQISESESKITDYESQIAELQKQQ